MGRNTLLSTVVILTIFAPACFAGLTPINVAVVTNSASAESVAVASYYCDSLGVPRSHIVNIGFWPVNDVATIGDYRNVIVPQIRAGLLALGSGTTNPTGDPIQCLVMTYGVPYIIAGDSSGLTTEPTSVDSYLTLLFNSNPDLGPDQIDGDTNYPGDTMGPRGVVNPYCWRTPYSGQLHPAQDFASFRASSDNVTTYTGTDAALHEVKVRYLVNRLDGRPWPTVHVEGYGDMPRDVKALIDRGAASAGQVGRFVLDEPWHTDYGYDAPGYGSIADALSPLLAGTGSGSSLIVRDGVTPDCLIKDSNHQYFGDDLGVMGYMSMGMHDTDILQQTFWGRTGFRC